MAETPTIAGNAMHKLKKALEQMAAQRGLEKGSPHYKRYVNGGVDAALKGKQERVIDARSREDSRTV